YCVCLSVCLLLVISLLECSFVSQRIPSTERAMKAVDVVFLSPPWGGPAYSSSSVFDLHSMSPLNGYPPLSSLLFLPSPHTLTNV
ncbi:hypothetical protein GBAR_LOCUS1164, partial [Geodia barretti]